MQINDPMVFFVSIGDIFCTSMLFLYLFPPVSLKNPAKARLSR